LAAQKDSNAIYLHQPSDAESLGEENTTSWPTAISFNQPSQEDSPKQEDVTQLAAISLNQPSDKDSHSQEELTRPSPLNLSQITPRKTRAKPATFNNKCMPTNEKGFVKISKVLFNPETSQDMNTVDVIAAGFLGEVVHNYSEENKVLCKTWCKNLKIELSKAAKLKIIQEMIKNAQTFGYPWMVIQDIQEAWLDACSPKKRDNVGKQILQCSSKVYF
jgi:hypothetical protein